MERVSTMLNVFFILITIATVWQFYRASNHSNKFLLLVFIWMTVQFLLGSTNFYDNETTIPPRFTLLIIPAFILTALLFVTEGGRKFIDSLSIQQLTLLHTIRVPVEIALYYLFIAKAIPQVMTFEGRNFDIVVGLTAPFIFYFGFNNNKISRRLLIVWNIISLGLLVNIVVIALLSAKTPLQQLAFDQPNIAIAHFPFNWLPSVIVPLVLFAHLASLRQLLLSTKKPYNV